MAETAWLDATAQADLVRRGKASPAELVDDAIAVLVRVAAQLEAGQPWSARRPPVSA